MSDPLPTRDDAASGEVAERAHHERTVTIYDEDALETFHVKAEPTATVGHVVTVFYRDDLHREHKPDDRLRCDANGGDVFAHESERLEEYAEESCRELKWTFVGGTGGA